MPSRDPIRRTTRIPRLLDGVIQRRRASAKDPVAPSSDQAEWIADLEARVDALEAQLEGLQDSVHREAVRHETQIEELRARTRPDELARAVAEHGRRFGL